MPPPYAIRVYTTVNGWQDVAIVGPRGAQGDQGPVGPIGVPGPPGGTEYYAETVSQGPDTALAASTWTLFPIPVDPTYLTITKSDGTNADFTRNADGTLTIIKAGNYAFNFAIGKRNAALPDNSNMNCVIIKKLGSSPANNTDGTVISSGNMTWGSHGNSFCVLPMSVTSPCVANDRMAIFLWCNVAGNFGYQNFSCTRQGSGAQGAQGIPGVIEVYSQPAQPASTNNGAIWIDTDEQPPPYQQPVQQTYAMTAGYTKDRAMNPAATTINEISAVLATLIDDLKASGIIKP